MDADDPPYQVFTVNDDREFALDPPPTQSETHASQAKPRIRPTRNIAWTLRWAAALATIAVATSQLIAFAYQLSTEHTLAAAARAGALEATLPRASVRTVTETVARRLQN